MIRVRVGVEKNIKIVMAGIKKMSIFVVVKDP
jgi:hypothetical protein